MILFCIDWANFNNQFWPGLASTFVGAGLAIISTLWINRCAERKNENIKREENKDRLKDCLGMLRNTIQANVLEISTYVQLIANLGINKPTYRLNLDTTIWDILKIDLINLSGNKGLNNRISEYSLRVVKFIETHKTYLEFYSGFVGTYGDYNEDKKWFNDYLQNEGNEIISISSILITDINNEILSLG